MHHNISIFTRMSHCMHFQSGNAYYVRNLVILKSSLHRSLTLIVTVKIQWSLMTTFVVYRMDTHGWGNESQVNHCYPCA